MKIMKAFDGFFIQMTCPKRGQKFQKQGGICWEDSPAHKTNTNIYKHHALMFFGLLLVARTSSLKSKNVPSTGTYSQIIGLTTRK